MFIRNPYDLLLEAAGDDLTANTEGCITENAIHESLNSIEEVDEDIVIAPNMVPVIRVSESYLVEMQAIASFMKSNGITSTEKALDAVAEANNLMPKEVGLLIESDDYVDNMLEKANCKPKKAKNKVLDKVRKATKLTDKLKKDGYTVKKKKAKCGDIQQEAAKRKCKNKKKVSNKGFFNNLKGKDESGSSCAKNESDESDSSDDNSYSEMFNFNFK